MSALPELPELHRLDPDRDLFAAVKFGERVRALDPAVEPFVPRLVELYRAAGGLRELWRIGEGPGGQACALSFAGERPAPPPVPDEPPEAARPRALEIYGAVDPAFRRQGYGRGLLAPLALWARQQKAQLYARAVDGDAGAPGRAFLQGHGFQQCGSTLLLVRPANTSDLPQPVPAVRVWAVGPSRGTLLAELDGQRAGVLKLRHLEGASAIEDLEVVPALRRNGVGRSLLGHALRLCSAQPVLLRVEDQNQPALRLYIQAGFRPVQRTLAYVWSPR